MVQPFGLSSVTLPISLTLCHFIFFSCQLDTPERGKFNEGLGFIRLVSGTWLWLKTDVGGPSPLLVILGGKRELTEQATENKPLRGIPPLFLSSYCELPPQLFLMMDYNLQDKFILSTPKLFLVMMFISVTGN